MKIRMQKNSVRYRLAKQEVEQLRTLGYVEESITFPGKAFSYSIQKYPGEVLLAVFESDKIELLIPETSVADWPENNVTGFDSALTVGDTELLIIVEKDFKCLDRPEEDQSDKYDNPKEFC